MLFLISGNHLFCSSVTRQCALLFLLPVLARAHFAKFVCWWKHVQGQRIAINQSHRFDRDVSCKRDRGTANCFYVIRSLGWRICCVFRWYQCFKVSWFQYVKLIMIVNGDDWQGKITISLRCPRSGKHWKIEAYSLIIGKTRSPFHLGALEAVNIETWKPILLWLARQDRHFT